MSLPTASAVLFVVLVLVALTWLARVRRVVNMRAWRQLATIHRLKLDEGKDPYDMKLSGDYRGVPLLVSLGAGRSAPPLRMCTRIAVEQVGVLPHGLLIVRKGARVNSPAPLLETVNEDLDALFDVYASELEKVQQVLGEADVRALLVRVAKKATNFRIDGEGMVVEYPRVVGPDIADAVESVALASILLAEAHEKPWNDFARKYGMMFLGAGTDSDRVLRGRLEGVVVVIRAGVAVRGVATRCTTVRASIGMREPSGLNVVRREAGTRAGSDGTFFMNDKELDKLVAVTGRSRKDCVLLLRNPKVKQHLTKLFATWPDVGIEMGAVIARRPGLLAKDFEDMVAPVIAVALVIRETMMETMAADEAAEAAQG